MQNSKIANTVFLLVAVSVVSSLPTADAAVLEEVIVTAQKREQNLQDVGVSTTAFSGEALRELNMTNSVDVAAQTPGLNIGTPVGEGNNPSITLRGVGLNDFNDNNEGPIAVYRDEVYQSAMPGLTFQLFDLERVEVLRGPQGTLYGRNATGGLIHFISNKPTDIAEGYVDLTLAEYSQVKIEAAAGGGITDNIQGRIAFASNDHDGYVSNRNGPDANEANSFAARGQLNVDFSNSFSALFTVHGADSDTNAPQYQHQVTDESGTDFWGYSDRDNDNFAGEYSREGTLNIETLGTSLTFNWSTDTFDLVSISAFSEVEKRHLEDTDVGPRPGIEPSFASENEQFSQEFRLSGETNTLRWTAGLFYFDNQVDSTLDLDVTYFNDVIEQITEAPDGTFGPGDELSLFLNYDVDYSQSTDSSAVFGQIEWDIAEQITLITGLRYTNEDRTINYQNRTDGNPNAVLNSCLVPPGGDPCDLLGNPTDPGTDYFLNFTENNPTAADLNEINTDNVSGRVGLDYRPNEDLLIFTNVSRGFKSGGFNGGFLDFTDGVLESDVPFDEEQLTSYELGIKSTLANGIVRFNATAFYYDYRDYQALTFSGLSQFISNSDATAKGLELEFVWLPGEQWDISLGASFLDTEIDSVLTRDTTGATEDTSITNTEMVLAPQFSVNGLVRYQATKSLSLQLDFNHQGEHFFDVTNSAVSKEDAYTSVNARLGYAASDNLDIALFVKNLSDEEYRVYTFDFTSIGGFNQQFYAPPRWAGASLNYRF